MKLKAGVDNSITRQINIEWYIVIPKGILIKGIKTIIGKLVVIQCTIDLIKIIVKILDHNNTKIIVDNRHWKEKNKLDIISSLLKENGDLF